MNTFTVYPAIDLRAGKVVRLVQGDPDRQTVYGNDPAQVALQWLEAGASWLHVVNLDGAFSGALYQEDGDKPDSENLRALKTILAQVHGMAKVQLGGGLRSLDDIEHVLTLGVDRAILGTVAVESPELVAEAVARFGAEKIAVGLDARDHQVRIRGWVKTAGKDPIILGKEMRLLGVERVIYTNIARDGVGDGIDVIATQRLAEETGLKVIASGGAASLVDVQKVKAAGLEGIIIGQALYTGQIDLREALQC